MSLAGHSGELSLPNLLQLKALDRGTCRVVIDGPAGPGLMVVEGGRLVHAAYGGLTGKDAAHVLVTESDLYYKVKSEQSGGDGTVQRRSMDESVQQVLMEGMQRHDEGMLPLVIRSEHLRSRPAPALSEPPDSTTSGAWQVAAPPEEARQAAPGGATSTPPVGTRPAAGEPPSPNSVSVPNQGRGRKRWPFAAAAAALVVALGLGWALTRNGDPVPPAPRFTAPEERPAVDLDAVARDAVEADSLTGLGDRAPVLEVGSPPISPEPDGVLRPTVICRILIDQHGRVVKAEVYRSRSSLLNFEEVALTTVSDYRFSPALDGGEPVPVWVNWPIDFV